MEDGSRSREKKGWKTERALGWDPAGIPCSPTIDLTGGGFSEMCPGRSRTLDSPGAQG